MKIKNVVFGLCIIVAAPLSAMELSDPDRFIELESKTDAFEQLRQSQMKLKDAYAKALEKGVVDRVKRRGNPEALLALQKSEEELKNLSPEELKDMAKKRDEMTKIIERAISRPINPRFAQPESKEKSRGWFSFWR